MVPVRRSHQHRPALRWSRAGGSRLGWGLHPPPAAPTESRGGYAGAAAETPACLRSLLEAFPLCQPAHGRTSAAGSAELETRAACSRRWCENAASTRCQSGSVGVLGLSVVYTHLHKNEVRLVNPKRRRLSPCLFFLCKNTNLPSLQFETIEVFSAA